MGESASEKEYAHKKANVQSAHSGKSAGPQKLNAKTAATAKITSPTRTSKRLEHPSVPSRTLTDAKAVAIVPAIKRKRVELSVADQLHSRVKGVRKVSKLHRVYARYHSKRRQYHAPLEHRTAGTVGADGSSLSPLSPVLAELPSAAVALFLLFGSLK